MRKILFLIGISLFLSNSESAAQATVVETSGSTCMGENMSRKQAEQAALAEAKRKAVEYVSTHIKSETQVMNSQLENDLISANANAEVKILQESEKEWYKDANYGDCYRTKIKAEVASIKTPNHRETAPKGIILSSPHFENLYLYAELKDGFITGKIFNQNNNVTVTQLTIEAKPKGDNPFNKFSPHFFNINLLATPQAMSNVFSVETGALNPEFHDLRITEAKGTIEIE